MDETVSIKDKISGFEKKMAGIVEHATRNFATLRVGFARPDFLEGIKVEAYGQTMPLNQVATIGVLDNFSLSVSPFDKSNNKNISKAIQEANLGVGIINEATYIRITMPKITEERRKEYVKILKKYTEDGKVSIRGVRRDANDAVKNAKKNNEISEDEAKRLENDIQKLTDKFVDEIDKKAEVKEKEIMSI